MSDHCRIGVVMEDGSIESIYCHEGYVVNTLLDFWTDPDKVKKLMQEGNVSKLGEEIGEKHDPTADKTPESSNRWCVFYRRDKGEKSGTEAIASPTEQEFWLLCSQTGAGGQAFLFRDGAWYEPTFVQTKFADNGINT